MLILPREELRSKITENPKKHNAIIIGASELELLGLSSFCKESLVAMFKDIVNPDKENAPTLDKVKECIDWGVDKEDLLVSCAAGISRSSAIAYLIECARSGSPEASISVLDVRRHRPNQLILCYGSQILGKDIVAPIYELYMNELKNKPHDLNLKYYFMDLNTVKDKFIG
jgi:predicted protein tyrosine phosphatase